MMDHKFKRLDLKDLTEIYVQLSNYNEQLKHGQPTTLNKRNIFLSLSYNSPK